MLEKPRVLVCIGGGGESLSSLRYASRLERNMLADVDLLYVRPPERELATGGLSVSLARENILEWGGELPGVKHLLAARDRMVELGDLPGDAPVSWSRQDAGGDPVGDHHIVYQGREGRSVGLHLKVSNDVPAAVAEFVDKHDSDLVIVGASGEDETGLLRSLIKGVPVAYSIAKEVPCSCIVARGLEESHGYLFCTDGTERALAAAEKVARMAKGCECPIAVLSVAPDETEYAAYEKFAAQAAEVFRAHGVVPFEVTATCGEAAECILSTGRHYSLIAVGDRERSWFRRSRSVAFDVLRKAANSVMVVR